MRTRQYIVLKLLSILTVALILASCNAIAPAPFPYKQDFSADNGNFTFVNTAQTNKWEYGNAAGNPARAIYISNTNGGTNAYNTGSASIVHTYRDIVIPAGTTITVLSFDWRAAGENDQDYLTVWLVPSSFTPVAGTGITAGAGRIKVGTSFNAQSTWQTYTNSNLNLSSFAGTNLRLVFEWRNNNNSGIQPPAAVDNIYLGRCFLPTPMPVTLITSTTAQLNWLAPALPPNGYEYYLTTTNIPPDQNTAATGASNVVLASLSQLLPNTTYYWWIRSVCGANKSLWVSGGNFKTLDCNAVLPIVTVAGMTHNSASVQWPMNNGVGEYQIRYRPVGTLNWIVTNQAAALPPQVMNTFNMANLLPATLYEVEIAGICNGIAGVYSHNEFVTRCDPAPPNVMVSNITSTSALIEWSPVSTGSTYVMRWREVGTALWNQVPLPVPPASTFNLTGLSANKTYEVQIANQCVGSTVINPYSNPKVFTTQRMCENPPSGLTITQLLPTSAAIQWDPYPGATYVLRYRKVGIPSWTEVPSLVNNLVLTGLTELTKYEMQVVNICNGTPGNHTPPYYFTTPTIIYCQMHSGSSTGEHISKVTVKPAGKKTIENDSGASTYTDYTGVPKTFIEMIQGSTDNEIIIEKKWTGITYNEGIAVWIDFNRNGEFDINERVFTSLPNSDSPVSGKFNVPADAFISMTDHKYVVMRVAMERDGIPVNCTNIKNGEVEDYKVVIQKKQVPNSLDQNEVLIYPNPVRTLLYVKNISRKANYKLYNVSGQFISGGIIVNNKIDMSKLINSVYVIYIEDNGNTIQKKFIKE
ncbi:fibronectin type III domain-containing protein [Chryseobacterium sediminis]|uniref:T9SS type A sorting domain-containing protein n=1 Tax=Chryseobacterium sediminis TaxID=1679494 RepID=A0A5B2UDW9_9FLAO|nr:fibronectin type III domain-containing protein [Chryseobacterium sediminis]KAA2224759.1 T9SS type A sorting domain-containing protein [Chryseobacterium sediminis]